MHRVNLSDNKSLRLIQRRSQSFISPLGFLRRANSCSSKACLYLVHSLSLCSRQFLNVYDDNCILCAQIYVCRRCTLGCNTELRLWAGNWELLRWNLLWSLPELNGIDANPKENAGWLSRLAAESNLRFTIQIAGRGRLNLWSWVLNMVHNVWNAASI